MAKIKYGSLDSILETINVGDDIPVIIGNWDETHIFGISQDRKDHLLGKVVIPIIFKLI